MPQKVHIAMTTAYIIAGHFYMGVGIYKLQMLPGRGYHNSRVSSDLYITHVIYDNHYHV